MNDADPNRSTVGDAPRAMPTIGILVFGLVALVVGLGFLLWSERTDPVEVEPPMFAPDEAP